MTGSSIGSGDIAELNGRITELGGAIGEVMRFVASQIDPVKKTVALLVGQVFPNGIPIGDGPLEQF